MSKVESFFAVVCLFVDFVVRGYSGAVAVQGAIGMAQALRTLTIVQRQLTPSLTLPSQTLEPWYQLWVQSIKWNRNIHLMTHPKCTF